MKTTAGSERILFGGMLGILRARAAGLEVQDVSLPRSSGRDKSQAGRTFVTEGRASFHRSGSPCSLLAPLASTVLSLQKKRLLL